MDNYATMRSSAELMVGAMGKDNTYQDFMNNHLRGKEKGQVFRRDKQYSKRMKRRLVYKNGECNISQTNIKKMKRRYLADIFTTLIDMKWRYTLTIFVLGFVLSWTAFAVIWWLIAFSHDDINHYGESDWKPCIKEVYNFATALLFSVETQHTIGYGSRHTTEFCPEAIVVMMMQSCFGVILQALMTGLVFAKLSRPKKRAETLMFSKNAVICKRNGQLCLMFRVGDMRKSQIVEAHVRVMMIKKSVTREGEVLPLEQHDINVGYDAGKDRVFLVWPIIVTHAIDKDSPFWDMSAEDLYRENFEVVIILEGVVESTGMTTQARSSYLPGEILWGHRFERLITFQRENGEYQVDYSRFHSTIPIETPQYSAKILAEEEDEDEQSQPSDNTSSLLSGAAPTATTSRSNSRSPVSSPYLIKRNGSAQTNLLTPPPLPTQTKPVNENLVAIQVDQ